MSSHIFLFLFKALFQVTLHVKMAMTDLQQYPWILHLVKNVEDNVVFPGVGNVMCLCLYQKSVRVW